jgi:hypothetical protein
MEDDLKILKVEYHHTQSFHEQTIFCKSFKGKLLKNIKSRISQHPLDR